MYFCGIFLPNDGDVAGLSASELQLDIRNQGKRFGFDASCLMREFIILHCPEISFLASRTSASHFRTCVVMNVDVGFHGDALRM